MTRLGSLDALRGVLAVTVVICHLWPEALPGWAGHAAVGGFFAMSAFVLRLGYDGRYWSFVAKRAVRLWPTYAVCIGLAALLLGRLPSLWDALLLPWGRDVGFAADPPSWSLVIEWWAAPALPVVFWAVRAPGRLALLVLPLAFVDRTMAEWALCFVLGAAAGGVADAEVLRGLGVPGKGQLRQAFRPLALLRRHERGGAGSGQGAAGRGGRKLLVVSARQTARMALSLGRASYPLYLCHWPVIAATIAVVGFDNRALAIAPVAVVTWGLYRWVEIPSIAASRAVGRLRRTDLPASSLLGGLL